MFFIKKIFVFLLLIINFGCTSYNINKTNSINLRTVSVETPSDRYNIVFKEYLKRKFDNKKNFKPSFILKAQISFNSNETMSVSGLAVLNSTKAVVRYSLVDNGSNTLIKSGSIKTFPALSSSSNSVYSNEESLKHIKERLSQSSANKLYLLTKVLLRKLD
ncbi:hypothetical protein OA970_03405 [Alphaproteobacteria bacterium]|nr:hypothetical protein [Alphaproteobacteria bacterium]